MLSRIVLPMLSFLLLIPVEYYVLARGHLLWGAVVAVVYVVSIKSLEEAGLKLKKRITDADTGAKAEQAVAEALLELPDEYYVFHDLEFAGFNIDHVVLGPNGIFLVETKSQKGNITQENDVLLRNGRKFFKDFLKQCWRQAYSLQDHLGAVELQGQTIKPMLCFARGFVEIRGPVRGVAVLNVGYLRPYTFPNAGVFRLRRGIKSSPFWPMRCPTRQHNPAQWSLSPRPTALSVRNAFMSAHKTRIYTPAQANARNVASSTPTSRRIHLTTASAPRQQPPNA